MRASIVASVLVLAVSAGAAWAQGGGSSLTLQSAPGASGGASAHVIVDGAAWDCQGAVCTAGPGGADQPALRACRRVVHALGPVSAFTWQGESLTPQQVAACNTAAAGKR